MLAISPLRTNNDGSGNNNNNTTMEARISIEGDDFPVFSGGNLLDSIDFDDLFMGMHDHHNNHDHDEMLPDLEMDPELLIEFSLSGGEDSAEGNNNSPSVENIDPNEDQNVAVLINGGGGFERREKVVAGVGGCKNDLVNSKKESESDSTITTVNSSFRESGKGKKFSSLHSKTECTNHINNSSHNCQGKRKAKVDWTPELHRRFVQAVEQLGVDKAVPSRILELMGIDCLTRHNIASHLQKYRSHKKHLLAREAEAATWTQKRQIYGVIMGGGKGGANISPWHPPTMGFPPITPIHHHPFRPLHVWGHPTMDLQSRMSMWPKHAVPSPSPPTPLWTPPSPHPPPVDPSFWLSPPLRVPNTMAPAAPCLPQPLATTIRFAAPPGPVPGVPSQAMYRSEHGGVVPPLPGFDVHPTKESIDAALGDVLAKPYLPLPIGLKPPSIDSVLVELQRQGVPRIPPATCT